VHKLKGLAGNLEATDLQAAAIEMESLVKGRSVKTTPEKELNRSFAKLKNALEQALDAAKNLVHTEEKKTIESSKDLSATVPPELLRRRLKESNLLSKWEM